MPPVARRGRFLELIDREQARCTCLQVALAAHASFRDTGKFPEKLSDLKPGYLASLPDDPYTPQPLVYRHTANGAAVYSRFKNGMDDGGTIITYEAAQGGEPPDFGYRIQSPQERAARTSAP